MEKETRQALKNQKVIMEILLGKSPVVSSHELMEEIKQTDELLKEETNTKKHPLLDSEQQNKVNNAFNNPQPYDQKAKDRSTELSKNPTGGDKK